MINKLLITFSNYRVIDTLNMHLSSVFEPCNLERYVKDGTFSHSRRVFIQV